MTDTTVLEGAGRSGDGGDRRAQAASAAAGTSFAINANGDNALATLRYRLKSADIRRAEEPFESVGTTLSRAAPS